MAFVVPASVVLCPACALPLRGGLAPAASGGKGLGSFRGGRAPDSACMAVLPGKAAMGDRHLVLHAASPAREAGDSSPGQG